MFPEPALQVSGYLFLAVSGRDQYHHHIVTIQRWSLVFFRVRTNSSAPLDNQVTLILSSTASVLSTDSALHCSKASSCLRRWLAVADIEPSVASKGDFYDNALAELIHRRAL